MHVLQNCTLYFVAVITLNLLNEMSVWSSNFIMSSTSATGSVWYQLSIALKRRSRGCHYITDEIKKACCAELAAIDIGVMHLTRESAHSTTITGIL